MDAIKNFAISQLSVGINSTQLTAVVLTGQGSRFPATGEFNVVVYDASYANAALAYHAGKAAIYRVLSRSTDTLNFKGDGSSNREGQEGTSPITHNSSGATYIVMQALTAKILTDLEAEVSGGSNFVEQTHAELTTLKGSSSLVAGQQYLITDFQTIHVIPNTAVVHTGATENIIVTALTDSEFSKIAYTPDFPNDILEYDFDDVLAENGTTPRNGWITRRQDRKWNIDCDYDFRNVVFRKWSITAPTYSGGTSYGLNDICRSSGKIWKSIHAANSGNSPTATDVTHWVLLVDETTTTKVLWDVTGCMLGNVALTTDTATYSDFHTFCNADATITDDASNSGIFKNITMRSFYTNDGYCSLKDKTGNRNVFIRSAAASDYGHRGFDGNVFEGVYDNTFVVAAMYDNYFRGHIKWGVFSANVITLPLDEFYANVIQVKGNMVYNSIAGGSFHNNFLSNMNAFQSNSISTRSNGSSTSNQYGFYNNNFMNCGHVGLPSGSLGNVFASGSSGGIFSLMVTIGGDMYKNIFASNGGVNTIIFNVAYHFGHCSAYSNGNTFIMTGEMLKIIFNVTGSFSGNTSTSATFNNIIYNVAGDLHDLTLTPTAGTNYSTAVTALPA
jgi:hypothetical protein